MLESSLYFTDSKCFKST